MIGFGHAPVVLLFLMVSMQVGWLVGSYSIISVFLFSNGACTIGCGFLPVLFLLLFLNYCVPVPSECIKYCWYDC
jgi:hypothetical protein